eukprot:scaffold19060_cov62-Phaeocystis_antarctica.AAC.4
MLLAWAWLSPLLSSPPLKSRPSNPSRLSFSSASPALCARRLSSCNLSSSCRRSECNACRSAWASSSTRLVSCTGGGLIGQLGAQPLGLVRRRESLDPRHLEVLLSLAQLALEMRLLGDGGVPRLLEVELRARHLLLQQHHALTQRVGGAAPRGVVAVQAHLLRLRRQQRRLQRGLLRLVCVAQQALLLLRTRRLLPRAQLHRLHRGAARRLRRRDFRRPPRHLRLVPLRQCRHPPRLRTRLHLEAVGLVGRAPARRPGAAPAPPPPPRAATASRAPALCAACPPAGAAPPAVPVAPAAAPRAPQRAWCAAPRAPPLSPGPWTLARRAATAPSQQR